MIRYAPWPGVAATPGAPPRLTGAGVPAVMALARRLVAAPVASGAIWGHPVPAGSECLPCHKANLACG